MKPTTGLVTCSWMNCGGGLLVVAADLADHDDRFGGRVGLEQTEDVDERGADHRVAADADGRALPDPSPGEGVDDLVGQRARAGDDPDWPRRVDEPGHDPDFRLIRRDQSGTIWPEQTGPPVLGVRVNWNHVGDRDPLGDTDHKRKTIVDCLVDCVRSESRRYEDDRHIGRGLGHGIRHRVEDRRSGDTLALAARRDARDDVCPILDHLFRMKRAFPTSYALHQHPGIAIDEDAHRKEPSRLGIFTCTC